MPDVVEVKSSSWDWEPDRPSIDNSIGPLRSQWGADDSCIEDLLELSRHSIDGYEEANSLIFKVVKKANDNQDIRRRSAYISTCVKNAWINLHNRGYRFK